MGIASGEGIVVELRRYLDTLPWCLGTSNRGTVEPASTGRETETGIARAATAAPTHRSARSRDRYVGRRRS